MSVVLPMVVVNLVSNLANIESAATVEDHYDTMQVLSSVTLSSSLSLL
jgi:hypothetical protein